MKIFRIILWIIAVAGNSAALSLFQLLGNGLVGHPISRRYWVVTGGHKIFPLLKFKNHIRINISPHFRNSKPIVKSGVIFIK